MSSFVDTLENKVIQEVADWCMSTIEEVTKVLAPDGRPFGMLPRDDEQKLQEYFQVRGQAIKWQQWITGNADFITQKLRENGVAEDKIIAVHPFDLAINLALHWSSEMETMIKEQADGISTAS